ncbi:transmembrane 9 superfamily member 2-like isoform X1 [Cryptomeria japonica]|uniref:transmembrane 9 superfamily member 2-like isoform X1 n=1 Tax=Cryptomeria japonica TaxID=3369 RepID=UPI0027DA6F41|nr:transmembrane 9 superfamily member 2-like isoform X1 [Cryptomeria japonica]
MAGSVDKLTAIWTVVMAVINGVNRGASDHKYSTGDLVPLFANKVGPFNNPTETYQYFDLPFCAPDKVKEKRQDLGEMLNGDKMVEALYKLEFRVNKDSQLLCRKKLTKEDSERFREPIKNSYYFQMYYDDLPIWGFIGNFQKENKARPNGTTYLLYTHIGFHIFYNNDRVIEINVRTDPRFSVDITEDREIEADFMYSVKWVETKVPFEWRMDKYEKSLVLPHHIKAHSFSITTSCVTVLLLTGILASIYIYVLKNDFVKYSHDVESTDDQSETGWKYIHGDVFRYPRHRSLFCAVLGSGTQLFALVIFVFMLALVGAFYPYSRGTLHTALLVIYALTSGIAGYTSASFYTQLGGSNWVRNQLLTGCLFCGPLFLTFCFLNTVAMAYKASVALPLDTIIILLLIWTIIAFPLFVLGCIVGKNSKTEFEAPCRTTKCPRKIPPLPFYRGTISQMAMAGFLPFGVIYFELPYIFVSVWGHKIYTLYSILFIIFIILIIVTALVIIAFTYLQLAVEDHEWWWRSMLCGGSTGVYIFGYSLYYYFTRSDLTGLMQTSFFFGYNACICYGFFLMLGTVGFRASLLFVRHIYHSIKCD